MSEEYQSRRIDFVSDDGAGIAVTFFPNYAASSKREEVLSLDELAALFRNTRAPTKAELPWIKFALFGNKRTGNRSLRHDANVREISGILADYDGEEIPIDEAVDRLAAASIRAIVYASPSHTAAKPRWRVGCPTRGLLPAEEHYCLMSRLNGLLGGVLAGESWVLSQSYYYGAVGEGTEHRVEIVAGTRTIDTADDLDGTAVGKPNGAAAHMGGKPQADIAAIRTKLKAIPNNDEDRGWESTRDADGKVTVLGWNTIGLAVWRASGGSAEGLKAFQEWSSKHSKYNKDETAFRWRRYHGSPPSRIGFGTLVYQAKQARLKDCWAYLPQHKYMYVPTRELWPAVSVNVIIDPIPLLKADGTPVLDKDGEPVKQPAAAWFDKNQAVHQMTWAPGQPMIIEDRLVDNGGWIDRSGERCFNLYRPPTIRLGDAAQAGPWLDHVHRIYPSDADHIIKWCAHRRQRPAEKINHALVLIGDPGIGKDTLLEPVKMAVGPWNFKEVSPKQMTGRFNGFLKSVILRISETHDLGEFTRIDFYNHMKTITAAPPDVLRVDEKNLREHAVFNCCGIVYTSNDATGALYLPPDDRRHYIARSYATKKDFSDQYWDEIWGWYEDGGFEHVASYLDTLSLAGFNAKAPPTKTEAFWVIVNAGRPSEEVELENALDALGRAETASFGAEDDPIWPKAITIGMLAPHASQELEAWLGDSRNSRSVPARLDKAGYVAVRNQYSKRGVWSIAGQKQTVYARKELTLQEQLDAAKKLISRVDEGRRG